MTIWSAEIKELAALYESLKGKLPELEKELDQLIRTEDANVVMLYSRRCLEVIVTDLCECELGRPRKTEPLKGVIDKLNKEEKVPSNIIASMQNLNSLSTFGTHPKEFDPEQVKPVLNNLKTIIKWYLKYKDTQTADTTKPEAAKYEDEEPGNSTKDTSKPNKKLIIILSGFLLVTIVIVALFVFDIIGGGRQTRELEKSIAVLPFNNLSNDTSQVYFCEGIREAILYHLQKIDAFSVRSRTSADHYRNTEKTTAVIGYELNANYLVEGSIESEGNEVRVWVQLIDATTDKHVWAGDFIKEKVKIFSIQSEIAQKIASELKVVLSLGEIEKIDKRPTENVEAYQAYLRGRYYAGQPHFTISNWIMALENFREAVEIDTTFALAYAELARAHSRLRYLRYDLSESRLEKADQAAMKALQYGSEEPRIHLALGYYYLYGYRDNNQALKHLEIAEKGMPDNVEILIEKADIVLPQGRWEETIQLLEKASNISPRDISILTHMTFCLWCTRKYNYGLEVCDRAISIAPDANWPYMYKAYINWSWKGPSEETQEIVKHIDPEHEWYLFSLYWQEVGEGNLDAALQLMSDTVRIWGVHHKMWTAPQSMLRAFIYDYRGEHERARTDYQAAVETLEKKVVEVPDDPRYHSALGIGYAALGEKEKALKEGLKAIDLLPITKDAVYGITYMHDLAIIYTKLGEYDLALDLVEQLLSIPSWVTPVWLDWEIRFAPLKSHPRYQKLITDYAIEE